MAKAEGRRRVGRIARATTAEATQRVGDRRAHAAKAREAGMLLSMSRRGQPKANPQAGSFFRTLKVEQVYLSEYLDFDDAYSQIGHFIEAVYNEKRLHSAIGYVPPAEFEAGIAQAEREKGRNGALETALQNGIAFGGSWMEVWKQDLKRVEYRPALQRAAAALGTLTVEVPGKT